MTDLERTLRQALDALKKADKISGYVNNNNKTAIKALEAALAQQAEPVDFDRQVRDISAGIGLPSVESPIVPDPVIDCDCGRRWCWTDDAGWNAKQVEPVAWMYEHDGHMGPHIITQDRWPQCQEPWNETPLYTAPQQAKPVKGGNK